MITKRVSELNVLNEYGKRRGSQLVVLYGTEGIGKTTLLKDFSKDYDDVIYLDCSAVSEREQLYLWSQEFRKKYKELPEYPELEDLFLFLSENSGIRGKRILIFDEFQNIAKNSKDFIQSLFTYLQNSRKNVMIILCSSTVEWIENSMIKTFGMNAKQITGFLKIKEFSFTDFVKEFPQFTMEECINAYAVFGGIPAIWQLLDKKLSLKENMIHTVLNPSSLLYHYGMLTVARGLRETSVYNTILAALAEGRHKLNDLHQHTGFSRAKISVYIKNLMELDILEKDYSVDTEGRENVQKGLYSISNHYVDFTYKFLFPNRKLLNDYGADWFYHNVVKPQLRMFSQDSFAKTGREFIESENRKGNLPFPVKSVDKWSGKVGNIDIVAFSEDGRTLIGLCNFEKPMMKYDDYEWLLFCAQQAKLQADYIYLISAGGFDEELHITARNKKNIRLLTPEEM